MGKINSKILLVEDDKNAGFLLAENLNLSGFSVVLAKTASHGLELFSSEKFDLCILDIMLPDKSGLDLAQEIRMINREIPIIFLTARTLVSDRIEGFEKGCDDYITKPFNLEELLFRIRAILKRATMWSSYGNNDNWIFNGFRFNYKERTLFIDEQLIQLSQKEAELLNILCIYEGRIVHRTTILNLVWGKDDLFTSKSLDVYLTKLRKFIKVSHSVELINVHSLGYKFQEKK